jgi:FecR protein
MTTRQNDPEKEMSMTGDYLWDGSGAPDAEIQHLETILGEFRHAERPLVLPVTHNPVAIMKKPRGVLQSPWLSRCAAAVMLIALSLGIFFSRRASYNAPGIGPSWNVANLDGNPQIGSQSVWANQTTAKLYVGQTLTTNSSSRATLSEVDLGQIQIDPNSRVRLLRTDLNHKRLQLEVGTIHAAIWAPPGQFVVDTPSAVAIDLGCAYTLQVAPDGSGTIRTTIGWVGFHLNGRDSFIPAGAMCSTRPKVGPGVPYFEDASESLRNALHTFDQAESSSNAASSALSTILSQARPRDGLTLWHLLSRTGGSERAQVYTRFAALVPPPPGVTREGILALDPHMLDLYWNALDLGDISLWRFWEESSDHHATPTPQQILMKKATLLKKTQ